MDHAPFDQQVTFLYTRDLGATARFYEQVLGLDLVLDQGTCRIYRISADGFLGFCQRAEAPDRPAGGKGRFPGGGHEQVPGGSEEERDHRTGGEILDQPRACLVGGAAVAVDSSARK